jgi:ankyrin repeat protein
MEDTAGFRGVSGLRFDEDRSDLPFKGSRSGQEELINRAPPPYKSGQEELISQAPPTYESGKHLISSSSNLRAERLTAKVTIEKDFLEVIRAQSIHVHERGRKSASKSIWLCSHSAENPGLASAPEVAEVETLPAFQAQLDGVSDPVGGTCQWILDENFKPYRKWETAESLPDSVLVICAGPGYGKSVLAKSLYIKLKGPGTFAFFCRRGVEKRETATSILASFIYPLIYKKPDLQRHIFNNVLRAKEGTKGATAEALSPKDDEAPFPLRRANSLEWPETEVTRSEEYSFSQLWKVFDYLTNTEAAPGLVFIIDALDECDASSRELINHLRAWKNGYRSKFILTTRPNESHRILRDRFAETFVEVEAQTVSEDAALFVDEKLKKEGIDVLLKKDLVESLKRNIAAGSEGIFFVIERRLEQFVKEKLYDPNFPKTAENIGLFFGQMSGTFANYYRDMMKGVRQFSDDSKLTASALFSILLAAQEPLTNNDLCMAYYLPSRNVKTCEEFSDLEVGTDILYETELLCGYIVRRRIVVYGDMDTVGIRHPSAVEFLEKQPEISSLDPLDQLLSGVNRQTGHVLLARACLAALLLPDVLTFASVGGNATLFLEYSAFYWHTHVRGSGDRVVEYQDLLAEFFKSSNFNRQFYIRSLFTLDFGRHFHRGDSYSTIARVVKYDLDNVLATATRPNPGGPLICLEGSVDLHELIDNQTVLGIAVRNKNLKMVKLLLSLGASPKRPTSPSSGQLDPSSTLTPPDPILFTSITFDSPEIFSALIENKADPLEEDNSGWTILHVAASLQDLGMVTTIIERRLIMNIDSPNHLNETPLILAAAESHATEVVRYLLAKGANPDAHFNSGPTALHAAVLSGSLDNLSLVLQDTKNKDSLWFGSTALHVAVNELPASAERLEIVAKLVQSGVSLDIQDESGSTALHLAAISGQSDIVSVLLKAGANLELSDSVGDTPLFAALDEGQAEVVIQLLEAGADLQLNKPCGRAVLAGACSLPVNSPEKIKAILAMLRRGADPYSTFTDSKASCLHLAAYHGCLDAVKEIVSARKIRDPLSCTVDETSGTAHTALTVALQSGYPEIARFLIGEGAEVNHSTQSLWTPLHYAANRSEDSTLFSLILDRTRPDLRDAPTKGGSTALLLASRNGFVAAMDMLLGKRAKISAADEFFHTPLFEAAYCGSAPAVELLLERGAIPDIADSSGWTALHAAAKACPKTIVERILRLSNWHWRRRSVATPTVVAISNKRPEVATALLKYGVDPNLQDTYGQAALHQASCLGDLSLIKKLTCSGADLLSRNRNGQIPLTIAYQHRNPLLCDILRPPSSKVHWKDRFSLGSPMQDAAGYSLDEIKWYETCGLPLLVKDAINATPLSMAAELDQPEILQYLLESDEVRQQHVNLPIAICGLTPVFFAALDCNETILSIFCRKTQFDVTRTDVFGCTIFDYARQSKSALRLLAANFPSEFANWITAGEVPAHEEENVLIFQLLKFIQWLLDDFVVRRTARRQSVKHLFDLLLHDALFRLQDTKNWVTALEISFGPGFYNLNVQRCDYCKKPLELPSIHHGIVHNPFNFCLSCCSRQLCHDCIEDTKRNPIRGCFRHDFIQLPAKEWFQREEGIVTSDSNGCPGPGLTEKEWLEQLQREYAKKFSGSSLSSSLPDVAYDYGERPSVFSLCNRTTFSQLLRHLAEYPADIWEVDKDGNKIPMLIMQASTSDDEACDKLYKLTAEAGAHILTYNDDETCSTVQLACQRSYPRSLAFVLEQFNPDFDKVQDSYAATALQTMVNMKWEDALKAAMENHFDWVAHGEFEWLQELSKMSYSDGEIVDLLLASGLTGLRSLVALDATDDDPASMLDDCNSGILVSDDESIDDGREGPREFLAQDLHLTRPRVWLKQLDDLEEAVVTSSAFKARMGQALAKSERFREQETGSASRAAGVIDDSISNAASKSPGSDSTSPLSAAEPNANQKMQQGQSESAATADITIPIALGVDLPAPAQASAVHEDSAPSAPNAGSQPEQSVGLPVLSLSGTDISEAETAVEGNSPAFTTSEREHHDGKDAGATQLDADKQEPDDETRQAAIQCACKNLRRLFDAKYCVDGINIVTTSPSRPNVAILRHISKNTFTKAEEFFLSGQTAGSLELLGDLGFTETARKIQAIADMESQASTASNVLGALLDLAVVCFAGAHIERFHERYLGLPSTFVHNIYDTLVLERRHLQCLDQYLKGRMVWVFHESTVQHGSLDQAHLYISTTIYDLHSVWGPVWLTPAGEQGENGLLEGSLSVDQPSFPIGVLRFNLGHGWITPWQPSADEPALLEGEIFAHYTEDATELDDVNLIIAHHRSQRFLIGARPRLRTRGYCDALRWSTKMRRQGKLAVLGTSRPSMHLESKSISGGLSFPYVNLSASFVWKRKDGSFLKDRLLASWQNEEKHDPAIMHSHLGVEISACSGNARRIRLSKILGSRSFENYLHQLGMGPDDWEDHNSYFVALRDPDSRVFERFYRGLSDDSRKKIAKAVSASLKALMHTGLCHDDTFHAFWVPSKRWQRTIVKFTTKNRRWTGLLKDTPESCALPVITTDCLLIDMPSRAATCHRHSRHSNSAEGEASNVLETRLVINSLADPPRGLYWKKDEWCFDRIDPHAPFNLGDSGRLTFQGPVAEDQGVLMRWHNFRGVGVVLTELANSGAKDIHHMEFVIEDDDFGEARPALIHVGGV